MDDDTVRNHFKRYKQGGLAGPTRMNDVGGQALLSAEQLAELEEHLEQHLRPSAASVARWVKDRFEVDYNRYYETFADYKAACNELFAGLDAHAHQLRSLLADNFEIIHSD